MRVTAFVCASSLLGCATTAPPRPMQLQRVILYQNGIGYFERAGHVQGETLKLSFARGELDDVLKTLTVIDRLGAGVATVDVPAFGTDEKAIALGVRMSAGRVHDLKVSYAVPTPTWKAAYRVVMDDKEKSLLQGWAMVNNASQEDWAGVQLTLATGAPMSFVHDLHTPEYVKRPDINGNLIAPTVIGPSRTRTRVPQIAMATASSIRWIAVPMRPKTAMAWTTTMVVPMRTTTEIEFPIATTSVRTNPRPTTDSTTPMAAPIAGASS